ncbi:hypothetical protein ACI2K4_09300 [Micromonospora sp. NPDC050397]|uniref:hypothetical protein n=1 Tax=Micromonospora sp. NPDC050397 TaxID=3364279 RepID=UPI00384B2198
MYRGLVTGLAVIACADWPVSSWAEVDTLHGPASGAANGTGSTLRGGTGFCDQACWPSDGTRLEVVGTGRISQGNCSSGMFIFPMVIMWQRTVTMGGPFDALGGWSPVTGVELIVAALAAAATAGIGSGVQDAYVGLKGLLVRRLAGDGQAVATLESDETSPERWRVLIGNDLADSGAACDHEVLTAARDVLRLTDPAGTRAGTYTVTNNYGAVGEFHAPVTFNQGPAGPPAVPGTA